MSSSAEEILDVLGASVSFLMSDQPWSFHVVAGGGEQVGVWVTESPSTVTITVQVHTDVGLVFQSDKQAATHLTVSREAPHILCEFDDGFSNGQLAITLFPHLRIKEKSGRQ